MSSVRAGMKRKAPSGSGGRRDAFLPTHHSVVEAGTSSSKRLAGPRDAASWATPAPSAMRVVQVPSPDADLTDPTGQQLQVSAETPSDKSKGVSMVTGGSETMTTTIPLEDTAKLNPILPAGKVFSLRVGAESFQLSGASISSDAPSYFSHYFGQQLLQSGVRSGNSSSLYIDRDPITFRDIVLHLQGYHIEPRDGAHYVKLFADAQFYNLPRLTRQLLKSDIFVQVGHRHFQIARELFSAPGNTPNFFSLGFADFFTSTNDWLPGQERKDLLRPPASSPPVIPGRCGDLFSELLQTLRGYNVQIRSEAHRIALIQEARWFHLKGVEHMLLPCEICYNLDRQSSEITMRLEDLRQSGISVIADSGVPLTALSNDNSKPATPHSIPGNGAGLGTGGWVCYQRPFIDETSHELIVSISSNMSSCSGDECNSSGSSGSTSQEAMRLDPRTMRLTFFPPVRSSITKLFTVIGNKMGLPTTLPLGLMMLSSGGGVAVQPVSPATSGVSADRVLVRIGRDAAVVVDGAEVEWEGNESDDEVVDDESPEYDQGGADMTSTCHTTAAAENTMAGKARTSAHTRDTMPPFSSPHSDILRRDWIVTRALYRLRVETHAASGRTQVVLVVVRLEAHTSQRSRNRKRGFLS